MELIEQQFVNETQIRATNILNLEQVDNTDYMVLKN